MRTAPRKIMFVCTGNICRSPTADAILRHLLQKHPDSRNFDIQSSGLAGWHIGERPDSRSIDAAIKQGYTEITTCRAQQFQPSDYDYFDLILGLDMGHITELQKGCSQQNLFKIQPLLTYAPEFGTSVPDPYYSTGTAAFDQVVTMIEAACQNLLKQC